MVGIKTEILNKLILKAKDKNNGVYKLGEYYYRVQNKILSHFICRGHLFIFSYGFVISRGVVCQDYETNVIKKYSRT